MVLIFVIIIISWFGRTVAKSTINIKESCWKYSNNLFVNWDITARETGIYYWQTVNVFLGSDKLIDISHVHVDIIYHECADFTSLTGFNTFWVSNVKSKCRRHTLKLTFTSRNDHISEVVVILHQLRECPTGLEYDVIDESSLTLPKTLKVGESYQTEFKTFMYTKLFLDIGKHNYNILEMKNKNMIEDYHLEVDNKTFRIEMASIQNSNVNFELMGFHEEIFSVKYDIESVESQINLKFQIRTFKQYFLPLVQGLLLFKNSEALKLLIFDDYFLRYTIDNKAKIHLFEVYCTVNSQTSFIEASHIIKIASKSFWLKPLPCCKHKIHILTRISFLGAVTTNTNELILECVQIPREYIKEHMNVKVFQDLMKGHTDIMILVKKDKLMLTIRINITVANDPTQSVTCDLMLGICSSSRFSIINEKSIKTKIDNVNAQLTVVLDASFDHSIFYPFDRSVKIDQTENPDFLQFTEELIEEYVIENIQIIGWTFKKFKKNMKEFKVSISLDDEEEMISLGGCIRNIGCNIDSKHISQLEFNNMHVNHAELTKSTIGYIKLNFFLMFEGYEFSRASLVSTLKKSTDFQIPRVIFYSRYLRGRPLYFFTLKKDRVLQYVAKSTFHLKQVSCHFGEPCFYFTRTSMLYISSHNKNSIKLMSLMRKTPEDDDIFEIEHLIISGGNYWTLKEVKNHLYEDKNCQKNIKGVFLKN